MKNLFFDAGNTLLLFDYDRVASVVTAAGFPVSVEEVTRAEYQARFDVDRILAPYLLECRGTPRMQEIIPYANFLQHLVTLLGAPERCFPEIDRELREQSLKLWTIIAPGTREALLELKRRGHRLNVISNSDGSVEGIIEGVGLRDCFEQVFDSSVVGLEKPDPEFFRHALARTRAKAAESVYFGDFYSIDYLGARNAGMNAVLFDRADLYRHVRCARITRLSQVPDVL